MIKDYRIYKFSWKEWIFCGLEGLLFNGLISFLFFDSLFAMIPGLILMYFYYLEKRRWMIRKRMRQLRSEFQIFLNEMIAALQTGRSIENAFMEAIKDTENYLEKETLFLLEMKKISAGISVGEPLEKLMLDFSYRCHMEEMEYFSEVFLVGKRSGGNLVGIMKNTIRMLQERMEAIEELYTILADKQLEFYLMSVIPMVMIMYLRIGAGPMIKSLYGNLTGILTMSVCLVIYGGSYLYGKKILEIDG
jgi:tight adherence protein B